MNQEQVGASFTGKLLIIQLDDDHGLLKAYKRLLSHALKKYPGLQVNHVACLSPAQAIEVLEGEIDPTVQVVALWTDFQCPTRTDGERILKAAAAVRQREPRLRQTVVISTDEVSAPQVAEQEGARYMYKDAGDLTQIIRNLLEALCEHLP